MPLRELGILLLREGKRRILLLAGLFWIVAISVLLMGVSMPKRWDASTLIVTDAKAIIKPLLEGRAVPTTIADLMPVVTQTMMSHRILREVAAFGGWSRGQPLSPAQEERLLLDIKRRMKIETQRDDAVKISYFDSNPTRAYQVTNKLAEIFIRECTALKEKQSRDAYEFIARRVQEYQDKLSEAHEKLLAYYQGKGPSAAALVAKAIAQPEEDTAGDTDQPAAPKTAPPRARISSEELAELRVEEATLKAQLDDRKRASAAPLPSESRQAEDQARGRVLQLQADLDRLSAQYTEQHPDVLKVKRELKIAQEDLAHAQKARKDRDESAAAANAQESASTRALSARLAEVEQRISAATGVPIKRRVPGSRTPAFVPLGPPQSQTELEMRTVGQDAVLSEMVRRYNATKDVYEDLFKRRENARVSMDLDAEHRGLTLRVQEAAEMPAVASSVRLMYVALGGLTFAFAVPLVLLIGLVKLDPRVRSAPQIERVLHLPLLAAIPGNVTPVQRTKQRTHWILAASLVVGVFVVYAAALVMKMQSSS
jgi:uncharacterized protein involved in exopolysaccharide biosynthesis